MGTSQLGTKTYDNQALSLQKFYQYVIDLKKA